MDEQLPSVHVLVVDDSSAIREVLTQILEWQGATVTAVGTAEQPSIS
jgi:CheY-like chemotaxis protein